MQLKVGDNVTSVEPTSPRWGKLGEIVSVGNAHGYPEYDVRWEGGDRRICHDSDLRLATDGEVLAGGLARFGSDCSARE